MAKVSLVDKKVGMTARSIIKYQLLSHCFVHSISHSEAELDCLTMLGAYGECGLSEFCNSAVDENIFKVPQTVRNFLTKAEKNGLIDKRGKSRKKIRLKDSMKIQTKGNIVLNYKIYHLVDTKES
tara:strand:- start:22939 stop:23313 length:375 start_codon:yes stop_codon:yes gene_type:complete